MLDQPKLGNERGLAGLKAGYLPSKREVAVIVLILVVALGAECCSKYCLGQSQLVLRNSLTPLFVLSWLFNTTWVPLPTPSPSAPPFQPTPTPTNTWISGGHHSPIIVTPSPSPSPGPSSSPPVSDLKLGIYENDPSSGQPIALQGVDWSAGGPIAPGQQRNSSRIFFRNEGSVPITLSLSTSGWVFQDSAGDSLSSSYSQYFALTWDYDNSALSVGETMPITLTLAVAQSLVDVATFSFNLIVTMTY